MTIQKNLTAAPGEVYRFRKKSKESVVVCAQIDHNGHITRKALLSSGDAETMTCPRSTHQVSEKSFKILGVKRNKYKWGYMTSE